jgi:hypothetical protein
MFILILGKHLVWSRPNGNGGTNYYYYYDEITWVVGALALAWVTWFFVRRYRRARALRRPTRRTNYRLIKRIVRIKRELSARYLRPSFSTNIHAVGIGMLRGGDEYCIQVFINDVNGEMWAGAGAANDNGWFPGNGSYKIEFDVDMTKNATCGAAQVLFGNQAVLDKLSSFSDSIPSDDASQQVNTTIATGLSPCPPTGPTVTKIQCTTTTGPCVSGNTANWNAPVRYRVTVSNPTSGTLTNVPLNDGIYKTTGTPTFTATVAATDPHCVSGCTVLTPPTTTVLPPTVNYDYTFFQLWAATLPSLSPSPAPPAVIDYIVTYAPVCETDAQSEAIGKNFQPTLTRICLASLNHFLLT